VHNHIPSAPILIHIAVSAFYASAASHRPVQAAAFAEVEVALDDNISITSLSSLDTAPGGRILLLIDGKTAKTVPIILLECHTAETVIKPEKNLFLIE
jgi:hypothetical protein